MAFFADKIPLIITRTVKNKVQKTFKLFLVNVHLIQGNKLI